MFLVVDNENMRHGTALAPDFLIALNWDIRVLSAQADSHHTTVNVQFLIGRFKSPAAWFHDGFRGQGYRPNMRRRNSDAATATPQVLHCPDVKLF
jgi:hypothetical protein